MGILNFQVRSYPSDSKDEMMDKFLWDIIQSTVGSESFPTTNSLLVLTDPDKEMLSRELKAFLISHLDQTLGSNYLCIEVIGDNLER